MDDFFGALILLGIGLGLGASCADHQVKVETVKKAEAKCHQGLESVSPEGRFTCKDGLKGRLD